MKTRGASKSRGFTLIEILVTVLVIAVIGSTSYMAVTSSRDAATAGKLESDVRMINSAVQLFLANGGTLPVDGDARDAIDKLKTRADSDSAATSVGLTGSFIDQRIDPVDQTAAEAATSQPRAIWVPADRMFIVVSAPGQAGIKAFRMNNELAAGDIVYDSRDSNLKAATDTQWVWDYEDQPATVSNLGETPTPGEGTGPAALPTRNTIGLNPPTYSQSSGTFALINYDLSVSLSNPNPGGSSQIYYSMSGAPYMLYRGETFQVGPGTSINAYAATIDPDRWHDSDVANSTYDANQVTLNLTINNPHTSLSYRAAGGDMVGLPPETPAPLSILVTNLSEIPSTYQSSSKFEISYTLDGSNPLTSATAEVSEAFEGGFVPVNVPVNVGSWGGGVFTLRAVARALDAELFANSNIATSTISAEVTQLDPPSISPGPGTILPDAPITITLPLAAVYPAGSRIFYTTNGEDPGVNGGDPVQGTLYTGSFTIGDSGGSNVTARVYPPAGLSDWFSPSASASANYSVGLGVGEGALVGGASLYSTFVGNLIYASPNPGVQMSNITFYGSSRIQGGNLYLPGTPIIYRGWVGPTQAWSPANDNLFTNQIVGRQFTMAGEEIVPATIPPFPRVVDLGDQLTPSNYHVILHNNTIIQGKVFRQNTAPTFPVIPQPPPRDNNRSIDYGSYRLPTGPLAAQSHANVTLNSVVQPRLLAGNYGTLAANNNTAFVLGDPDNPEVAQVYNIEQLTLNSESDIIVVGKAIVNLTRNLTINNGSVLGNPDRPDWLQLNFYSGDFASNSGSSAYAQIVAPNSSVYLNNGSTFRGSVTAKFMQITSASVIFSLPPVIQQGE